MELENFIIESNRIEGEKTYLEKELPIYDWWLANECNEENLKEFHKRICDVREQLQKSERGVYRRVPVYVGYKEMTNPGSIRRMMIQFFGSLSTMHPYEAHRLYERIHPFVDLNGRTGRAIWLHQMLGKQDVPLGFLHTWYYQSLDARPTDNPTPL